MRVAPGSYPVGVPFVPDRPEEAVAYDGAGPVVAAWGGAYGDHEAAREEQGEEEAWDRPVDVGVVAVVVDVWAGGRGDHHVDDVAVDGVFSRAPAAGNSHVKYIAIGVGVCVGVLLGVLIVVVVAAAAAAA
jgi:hypothetical protein